MGNVYAVDAEQNLIIYTTGNHICLRTAIGESLTRPIVLRGDYASDLSDIVYNNTIYYVYKNREQDIVLRSIIERDDLYKISSLDTPDCFHPQIAAIQKTLILFYFVKNPIDNSYLLKSLLPFQPEQRFLLPKTLFSSETAHSESSEVVFASLPTLRILHAGTRLLVHLTHETEEHIFSIDESLQCTKLAADERGELLRESQERIAELQQQSQGRINELKQRLTEQQKQSQEQIAELQQQLQERIAEQQQIAGLQSELASRDRLIESIRGQYEELMDTATKYREEAVKWYNKFYANERRS